MSRSWIMKATHDSRQPTRQVLFAVRTCTPPRVETSVYALNQRKVKKKKPERSSANRQTTKCSSKPIYDVSVKITLHTRERDIYIYISESRARALYVIRSARAHAGKTRNIGGGARRNFSRKWQLVSRVARARARVI